MGGVQKAVDYPWKPTVTYLSQYVHECYRYRHLMMHLARSDLRGRFRGSYVGGLESRVTMLEHDTEVRLGKKTHIRWRWSS